MKIAYIKSIIHLEGEVNANGKDFLFVCGEFVFAMENLQIEIQRSIDFFLFLLYNSFIQ